MNYKNVNKKQKNKVVIIVSLILALVIAGGAIAGIGYATDWFKNPDKIEDVPNIAGKKEVPTSTYNLELDFLEDILGLNFTEDKWSWHVSFDAEDNVIEEGSEIEAETTYFGSILDVGTYGDNFIMPKDGIYTFTFKVNGEEYVVKDLELTQEYVEGFFFLKNSTEEDPIFFEFVIKNMVICDPLEQEGGEGYTLQVYAVGFELETFEIVSFERTGDIPVEDNTDGENA